LSTKHNARIMATIHSVLQEGSAVQLGPVKVEKTYPRKPGDKNRFLLISDSSGKGALKIWGAAANTELQEGQTITLIGSGPRGGLKTTEFNGKTSIDANDCRLEFSGGQQQAYNAPESHQEPSRGYSAPQSQPARPSGSAPSLEAIAKQAARMTSFYIDELVVNHGFSKDEAIMLAQGSHSIAPLWWFGEKGQSL
jgi:hypothetical protein